MTTRPLNPARPLNLVRPLNLDDCQAVADLETQLFAGRFTAQSLRDMLNKPAFYGAVLPAVGQAVGQAAAIHAYYLSTISADCADIIAIGTHRDWQRRGFGRIMLEHLIGVTEQQHVKKILMEVAADNMPARQLYDSCGFVEIGCRKNYYKRGETRCDAVIMARLRGSAFS
ncbi:MAG: GNAT family N-acetyltransferase [Candidatus Puniceispirillum sp.]|nr:GNAT family N-acetyltransferase [Candidatus Puniceispirillum sp.]